MALAQVRDEGGHFGGTIGLDVTPERFRTLFDELEKAVNGQLFSLLDEVQERISSLNIKAVFENDGEAPVVDLQVFPSSGEVSFKLADVPARAG